MDRIDEEDRAGSMRSHELGDLAYGPAGGSQPAGLIEG